MSEWRYILKRTVAHGRPGRAALANRLKNVIRAMGLTFELPVMKIETKPGHEFYVGIAVNDDRCGDNNPPEYLIDVFNRINQPLNAQDLGTWPTSAGEVDGWLGGAFEWDHMTKPLIFESEGLPILPANLIETEEVESKEDCEGYDRLIWWCSCKGTGSVSQISEISNALGLNDLEGSVWGVLKKLALLGHLDVFQSEDREWSWRIAPTTIVGQPPNESFYIAGAMSGRIKQRLAEMAGATFDSSNGGPTKILLPTNEISHIANAMGFTPRQVVAPLSNWAHLLPSVDEWQESLNEDPAIVAEPHQYSFSRYSNGTFLPVNNNELPAAFYRVQRNGNRFLPKHVLHLRDGRWLNGDYASLRFLSLGLTGQIPQAQLHVDGRLAMSCFHRWPNLYERALVLASGQLPATLRTGDGTLLLTYSGLARELVDILAGKLRVDLIS
jgi:hypothetical protein